MHAGKEETTMLINFTVSNFRSFKEEALLNLAPAKRIREMSEHILHSPENKAVDVLPVSVMYGKNGSGKTTFIDALQFMKLRITQDIYPSVTPFRLADELQESKPTRFSILFKYCGIVYDYGFSLHKKTVQEEWLSAYFTSKPSLMFERYMENGKPSATFGQALVSATLKGKSFLGFIMQGIKPEELFLREAVKRNVSILAPIVDWFSDHCFIIKPESTVQALELILHDQTETLNKMNERIKEMDLDVDALSSVRTPFDVEKFCSRLGDTEAAQYRSIFEELQIGQAVTLSDEFAHPHGVVRKTADGFDMVKLEAGYTRLDGKNVNFDMALASSGMNRMIHLLPALDLIHGEDTVFVIDELERSLHTLLAQYFIKNFISETTNAQKGNQLIFSTHDTNLLDANLFRSDEIWLIEKDQDHASHLCNLVEFKLTTGLNYEKGYLNGRFGAIPVFHGDTLRIH
jgi:AAA15 family ATPase/GTPase